MPLARPIADHAYDDVRDAGDDVRDAGGALGS